MYDVDVKKSPYKASWCTQFNNVLWRSWLEVSREPMIIKVKFLQVVVGEFLIKNHLSIYLLFITLIQTNEG